MFETAKLKVERANQHINEVHSLFVAFAHTSPYEILSNFDEAAGCYGLRVAMHYTLPKQIGIVIGDVIHNLRTALEHVAGDLVFEAKGKRSRSKFPMHETRKNLVDAVNQGKIHACFPEVSRVIIDRIKPYKGGNDLLWTVGKLWNIDKHTLPITSYGITRIKNIKAESRENGSTFIIEEAIVSEGRILNMIGSSVPITVIKHESAALGMQFNEPGLLEGDEVIPTLLKMSELVSEAIDIIEQAYSRS